ncbi:hypothetical protein OEZ85_007453 [Tetradesmus obliquus]|uniref:DAGKc domain-containing protein n=1 Tax=Tetradesmus obliquus TaxID=3088 RepID=A0ABY8TG98_TETOB|nr:hypothetical protein OEZ85_007453 [Tetradesmus obliquus]
MATTTKAPPKQAAPPAPAAAPAKPTRLPPTEEPPAEAPASASDHGPSSTARRKKDKKKPAAAAAAAAAGRGSGSGLDPKTTRSLLVVLHGKRVDDDLVRDAISSLKEEGHQISVRVTFDRGDVDAFVAEAIRLKESGTANYETIVAGGGDGTLNEVVAAMMDHKNAVHKLGLAVALLPLGTANDFACTAGISVDPLAALKTALDPGCIRPIDVAAVNGKHFVNIAVAGSIAEVSPEELASPLKRLLGPIAIGFHVLKRVVCPDALLDDGLLDFTLWTGESAASEATALLGALVGGGNGRAAVERGIAQLRASWLLLQAPPGAGPIPVNRDGEPEEASHRLLFEVLPRVLPMHLPDTRMLLEGRQQQQQVQPHMSPRQQQQLLQQQHSADSTASSSSIRGNVYTEGKIKSAAVEAGDGSTSDSSSSAAAKQQKRGRRHRKLRKRTLQRMMFDISQPEGWEVRQRQKMLALTRKLASWGALLLLGGAAGWAYKARQERQQQREERQRQRQRQQQPAAKGVPGGAGGTRHRRGSSAVFA